MSNYTDINTILEFLERKLNTNLTKNSVVFYDESKKHYSSSKLKKFRGKLLIISLIEDELSVSKRFLINEQNFIDVESSENYIEEWNNYLNNHILGDAYGN